MRKPHANPDGGETDFWLSTPCLAASIVESEADVAAGRTYGEHDIRTAYRTARGES